MGVNVTAANRKQIDQRIQELVGVSSQDCPTVWREVKKRLEENETRFTSDLAKVLSSFRQG
jgi:ribosomal protein L18E